MDDTTPAPADSEKPKQQRKVTLLAPEERQRRLAATTLIHGDAVEELKAMPDCTADVVFFDRRIPHRAPYGTLNEEKWHSLMDAVLCESANPEATRFGRRHRAAQL